MVTLTNPHNVWHYEYVGKSTDTKPTDGVPNGSCFREMDTGDKYYFDAETQTWINSGGGGGGSTDNKVGTAIVGTAKVG